MELKCSLESFSFPLLTYDLVRAPHSPVLLTVSLTSLQKDRLLGQWWRRSGKRKGALVSFIFSELLSNLPSVCFLFIFVLFICFSCFSPSLPSALWLPSLSSGFSSGPDQQLNPQLSLWSKWGTDNWLHVAFAPGTEYLIYSWLS